MLSSKVKSLTFCLALSSLAFSSTSAALAQVEPGKESNDKKCSKKLGFEEMRDHRQLLREDLMVPSLKGIRGISFGIPGHNPFPTLEKVVGTRLKQLPIPVHKIPKLKSGDTKPVDAILQVKVLAAGNSTTVVELTLTQWSKLVRDPKIQSRSITYTDQAVTHNSTVGDVAGKMVNQFVLDYLKANNGNEKKTKSKKG